MLHPTESAVGRDASTHAYLMDARSGSRVRRKSSKARSGDIMSLLHSQDAIRQLAHIVNMGTEYISLRSPWPKPCHQGAFEPGCWERG